MISQPNPTVQGIVNLDALQQVIDFLPLSKIVMKEAAQLWAEARRQGIQTADKKNIDADIIIAAQWKLLKEEYPGQYIVIATTNVKHLERFTEAKEWKNINSIFREVDSSSRFKEKRGFAKALPMNKKIGAG